MDRAAGAVVRVRVGIVGHEAAKFTRATEAQARAIIRAIVLDGATLVVSGESPLGGIDAWAREEAQALGVPFLAYPPQTRQWDGPGGFKERNLQIATESDIVHCIVVAALPPGYSGRRFLYCYHCRRDDHVKSGGCWTAFRCQRREWHVIR